MSGRIKKFRKIKLPRISSMKPSKSIIILSLITLSIFILGGGVYDIMEQPLAVLPTPGNPGYYPDITHQFLTESISFIFFLIIGISGGYISFRSIRYGYRPRVRIPTLVPSPWQRGCTLPGSGRGLSS